MPVDCVQVNSSVIVELWFCPGCCYWAWVCCICISHEVIWLHDWSWKHVLLGFSISVNVENINFLPWVSWVGLNPSNELESICIFRCHCDVELSVLVASFRVQVNSSPVGWVRSVCAESWISEAWLSRWCESSSFQAWSRDLYSSFKICVVSNSWNDSPIINCLESTSRTPSKSSVRQTPSGSVPSERVPCFWVTGFIVSTILPCCTCSSWEGSSECIFNQQSCDYNTALFNKWFHLYIKNNYRKIKP